jgi:type VI secretion system secreted protein Hcp
MPIFLEFTPIKGDVTSERYRHWIALNSLAVSAGRDIGSAKGKGANREGSEPTISEITVTKPWDAFSSSKLFEEAVSGEMSRTAEIHFTTTGTRTPEPFLVIKLNGTGVASYSLSAPAEGRPSESLSLNFARVEIIPKVVDTRLGLKDGEKVSFNLQTMKANA